MNSEIRNSIEHHNITLTSRHLGREVQLDCWFPPLQGTAEEYNLLLINDGQNLEAAGFAAVFEAATASDQIRPLFCVGIYAGEKRLLEYGCSSATDYLNRGSEAKSYSVFILDELIPWIRDYFRIRSFREKAFAGFSLGGLSALDVVWQHPQEFGKVGVFSGSLWWRSKALDDPGFNESTDRIMHEQIREGAFYPWLRFFFECGTEDETHDRNENGVIDTIDDTVDLIGILYKQGYPESHIRYHEIEGGKHDMATWKAAWPVFLKWGWGR